jgi:flagellar assembly protein FliH
MNMKWSETIVFNQPLREVSRLTEVPAERWEELLRAREEAGYQRGRRDGENSLSQQLVQQRAEISELQRGILESLNRAVPQVIQESESAMVSIALEAAGRIVAGLPISVELVEGVISEALRQVKDSAEAIVQLHPEDLALLRKHDSKTLNDLPNAGPLRFVTSSDVTRGGCIVQTRFGLIDARREVKLEQLSRTVAS